MTSFKSLAADHRKLGRNVGWTIAGNVGFILSQFLVMAVIARMQGASDVGLFSLASSIVAPVLVISQLQLRIVLSTDVLYRHAFRDFLKLRGWTTLAMVAAVWVITVVSHYPGSTVRVVLAFAVAKAFDALSDILYAYHQRREDMRIVAVGQMVNGVLSVVFLVLALRIRHDLLFGMEGYAAASAAALLFWAVPVTLRIRRRDREDPRGQVSRQWALAWRALPLAIVLALSSLATSLPRFFIERSLGSYQLGIFAGVSYLIVAGGNVINSVGNAISPRLARLYASGSRDGFRRLAVGSIALGAGLGLAAAGLSSIVGGPLLELIYTPSYRPYGRLLTALCIAAALSYAASFAVGAATAAQRFTAQLPVLIVVCAAGLLASATLIPAWGLTGAVVATGLMGAVQLVGCGLVVRASTREVHLV